MRKNVKKQLALRVLSTAALMAMVSSIATAAFADTYNVTDGSVEIVAEEGSQYITQWEDKDSGTFVQDEQGNIDHREDTNITLTTKDETTGETETTSNTVTIDAKEDNTANVTLQDVHMEVNTADAKSGAIEIKGNGNTNLELNGDNTVLVENRWSDEHAAIEKADVYGKGTLTIKDDVNDDGSPKEKDENENAVGGDTGKLFAGGFHDTAAIGGGGGEFANTSNITITGGEIVAVSGHEGAGIGSGRTGSARDILITGNANVTAYGDSGAAIGVGEGGGSCDITITDHANVTASGAENGAGIGFGFAGGGTADITISGDATVTAIGNNYCCAIGSGTACSGNVNVNIKDNATVNATADGNTAIGCSISGKATINITGGTVTAATAGDGSPAIGTRSSTTADITINSTTGKTTVNAYTASANSPAIGTNDGSRYTPAVDYDDSGASDLKENNSAIVNMYHNATFGREKRYVPKTLDPYVRDYFNYKTQLTDKGDLYKVVHNRKYMEEHPEIVDTSKLENSDLHDWQLVGEVVEPTLEADGYADYICSIDKCGQTKHVVLPKLTPEPSEPDTTDPEVPGGNTPGSTPDNTPDTPNKPDAPKQPDGTTPAPAAPETPVQDGTAPAADTLTADTTADAAVVPADAAVAPANAQGAVQNAKPEAAAAASTAAAAVLPQTGANWLAVVGTALSGMFLLAAGFVLDRKNRRMN